MPRRSDCPISNVLDVVGDKWSLLILRDILFSGKRSYSELQDSEEGIATNILSSRLEQLESYGLISKRSDEQDKRRKVYTPTQAGIDMLPILLEMIVWSGKYDPNTNAPKPFLEKVKSDRDGVITDLITSIKSKQ